ncbi:MAG TPA: GGDEF domain-containing protein [Jatrophihabitans sp.]|jgi:diguanylate cyclase (GGDEF)-like protein
MALHSEIRRRDDRLIRGALRRTVARPGAEGVDPVQLGRVLLLVAAPLVGGGVPALNTARGSLELAGAAVAMLLVAFAASFAVPWRRLGTRATLAFPVLVCGVLVLLSVFDAPAYAPLAGLLALCFAFIGLTQPPRTALAMLPVAGLAFVLVSGGWSAAVVIRLLIGCFVWSILGELLAHLRVRQEALSAALRAAAYLDVLTGIGNRRDLDVRLATAQPGDAVVLCDLDHFKRLNDTQGHHVGDRVLADFGSMLRATLRAGDYCARYGGEEFVLILPGTTVPEALATLDRMRTHWAVLNPATTFSAGVASCTADRPLGETFAAADRALYAAKDAGRDCGRVEPAADPSPKTQPVQAA